MNVIVLSVQGTFMNVIVLSIQGTFMNVIVLSVQVMNVIVLSVQIMNVIVLSVIVNTAFHIFSGVPIKKLKKSDLKEELQRIDNDEVSDE